MRPHGGGSLPPPQTAGMRPAARTPRVGCGPASRARSCTHARSHARTTHARTHTHTHTHSDARAPMYSGSVRFADSIGGGGGGGGGGGFDRTSQSAPAGQVRPLLGGGGPAREALSLRCGRSPRSRPTGCLRGAHSERCVLAGSGRARRGRAPGQLKLTAHPVCLAARQSAAVHRRRLAAQHPPTSHR